MAKKKEEKEEQVYTARVSDLELYLTVMVLTPVVDPEINQHPSDPACSWGVAVNLVGLNATRKSSIIRSVGRRLGLGVYTAYAPTKQPEDFSGAVVPTPNGIVIECILPQARACINQGGGILFIDETSDARPATQAALHSIPVEHRIGDHPLGPKTRTLMAMNPIEYATVGHGIGSGIASRMAHVWVDPPTRSDFCKWLRGSTNRVITASVGESLVARRWNKFWPQTVALAERYMRSADDKTLHNQPRPDDPRSGGPWPNPRAWHWFLCARTAAQCLDAPPNLELEIMETLMGPGVTTEWAEWVAKADLPSVEEILAGKWELDKTRPDRTYVCIAQMCEYMKAMEKEDRSKAVQSATAAWTQVQRLLKEGAADMAVEPAKHLALANLGPDCEHTNVATLSAQVIWEMSEAGFTPFAQ
jgi:hypothetical protein